MAEFAGLNTQVLGISIDHVPCLQAWAESLGEISFPLLSDFWPHGAVAQQFGVLREEGYAERALFVIDKTGVIQYVDVHDIGDQPSNVALRAEIRRLDPEAAAVEPEPLPTGGVVMYCSPWCPDCKRMRAWLQAANVDYTEVDVSGVPGAAAQVRAWAEGKLVTPTFDIEGAILVNPSVDELSAAL